MVASLLRDLIPEKFVAELDLSTLELFPTDHISEDLQERREDIVWRVGWKNGQWCYIALLLEFQSKPDPWMALRLLVYLPGEKLKTSGFAVYRYNVSC